MITVKQAIEKVLKANPEALQSLVYGYMNYSKFAKRIKSDVEEFTKKIVNKDTITMQLIRLKRSYKEAPPDLLPEIEVNKMSLRTPITELVYKKQQKTIEQINFFLINQGLSEDEFFTFIYGSEEITIFCSDSLVKYIHKSIKENPTTKTFSLAALTLKIKPEYLFQKNIYYSFLHKVAISNQIIVELVTTNTEFTIIHHTKDSQNFIETFSKYLPKI